MSFRLGDRTIRVRRIFATALAALGFSSFGTSDRTQGINRRNPADGTGGEAGLEYLSVRVKSEVCRVENAAPFFPICADLVGVFGNFEPVADWKCCAGALDHLLGFVQRIDGQGDDVGVLSFELFKMGLIIGDLPYAVRSPDAAVEDDDGVFAGEIDRNV